MTVIDRWKYWKDRLTGYFNDGKYKIVDLAFLKEVIEVEPDGYAGTDREYYFSKDDGMFYTHLYHWDGGNMFANRSYQCSVLSKEQLFQVLNIRKTHILQELSENDRKEFEIVFNDVADFLLRHYS